MDEICRICLQSKSKLISIESYGLSTAYEQLTGVSVEHDDGLPRELCVECATLLDKYHKFRDKSIRGDQLLRQIYHDYGYISCKLIKNDCINISPILSIHNFENIDILLNDDDEIKIHETEKVILEMDEKNVTSAANMDTYELDDTLNIKLENFEDDDDDTNHGYDMIILDKPTSIDVKSKHSKTKDKKKKAIIKKAKTKVKLVKVNEKFNKKCNNDTLLEEYFNVTELSIDEQVKSHEQRKDSINYLNNKFKCDFCFRGFQYEASYNTHMRKHSQDRGSFACKICQATFSKMEFVTKHHRQTHMYRYDCVKCKITIANRTSAVFHATWHKGRTYECEHCGSVFDKKSTYFSHIRIKHPSQHACQYCGYSFLGEKGVESHRNKKHFAESQVPVSGPWCRECDIQFSNEEALSVHNGIKHSQSNSLPRNETPKSGNKIIRNRKDSKSVRGQNKKSKVQYPVPCEVCGIELNSGAEYRFHFMRTHPDRSRTFYPYLDTHKCICDKCGKIFASKSFLSNHLLTHSDTACYSCTECHKSFKTPVQLRTHLKIHVAPSYGCAICGLMYNQKGNRDRHVRQVHSDEKNFKCDYCVKHFKSVADKRLHTRHIHWKEPWPKRNRTSADRTRSRGIDG